MARLHGTARGTAASTGTWGDHSALPSQLEQALTELRQGGGMRTAIGMLDADPGDFLSVALARLGRAVQAAKPQ